MAIRSLMLPSIIFLLIFTVLTGVAYPLVVTGVAQALFPHQANGSLIIQDGEILGSELIGQAFDDPAYFWGRPSATGPVAYNAAASSGSNLAMSNQTFYDAVQARVDALVAADPQNDLPIPVDLVTASGSGLDPQISPTAAFYQVPRIARERGLSEAVINDLVEQHIQRPLFGFWGQETVIVLQLNIALDTISSAP
jgi:K+-transporting ATPase ATPase C chain